jgi:serine/threonine protein kinase
MAPEQLNVKRYGIDEKISYNLDLWALGVTLNEVLTGKVLFKNTEGDSNEEIMANILAPGLQDKIAVLPEPFLDIVRRCLVKDARRRAQRAEELIELLEPKPEPIVIREPVVIREVVTVPAPSFVEIEEEADPEEGGNAEEARVIEAEAVKAKAERGRATEIFIRTGGRRTRISLYPR